MRCAALRSIAQHAVALHVNGARMPFGAPLNRLKLLPVVVIYGTLPRMSVLPFKPRIDQAQLALLVSTYVETGDLMRAALDAGMPLERASEVLHGQGVRSMVQRAMRSTIDALAAPYALAVLRRAMASENERVRVDAARSVLTAAGYSAPLPEQSRDRGLAELSPDELRALISGLQSELSDHARVVIEPDFMD